MIDVPEEIYGERQELLQERVDEYAEASGDHNPIHIDPQYAAGTTFRATIVHGMLAFGVLAEMLATHFGENWVRGSLLRVRFRAPIYVGTIIVPKGILKSDNTDTGARVVEYLVTCSDEQGNVFVEGRAKIDFSD
jgi:acyl dehydratase